MAENPALTVVRLLGGIALLNGNLGHQVLGQLLITNSHEVAVAGAAGVIAATSGQRNAAAQIAIRTAVPALAVRALLLKQERRLERRETLVAEREKQVEPNKKRDETIKLLTQRVAVLDAEREQQVEANTVLTRRLAVLDAEWQAASSTIAAFEKKDREQLPEVEAFRTDVVRQSGLTIAAPSPPQSAPVIVPPAPPEPPPGAAKPSKPRRTRKPRKRKA